MYVPWEMGGDPAQRRSETAQRLYEKERRAGMQQITLILQVERQRTSK